MLARLLPFLEQENCLFLFGCLELVCEKLDTGEMLMKISCVTECIVASRIDDDGVEDDFRPLEMRKSRKEKGEMYLC